MGSITHVYQLVISNPYSASKTKTIGLFSSVKNAMDYVDLGFQGFNINWKKESDQKMVTQLDPKVTVRCPSDVLTLTSFVVDAPPPFILSR